MGTYTLVVIYGSCMEANKCGEKIMQTTRTPFFAERARMHNHRNLSYPRVWLGPRKFEVAFNHVAVSKDSPFF
jgi:hypothetical protein